MQDIFFHFLSVGRSLGRAEHRRPAPADRLRRERSRGEPFPCRPRFRWNWSSTVAGSSPMVRLFQLRRRGRCHGSPPMTVTRDTTPLFVWFSPGPALEVQTANAAIGAHYGVLILPPSVESLIVFCGGQVDARCGPRRAARVVQSDASRRLTVAAFCSPIPRPQQARYLCMPLDHDSVRNPPLACSHVLVFEVGATPENVPSRGQKTTLAARPIAVRWHQHLKELEDPHGPRSTTRA